MEEFKVLLEIKIQNLYKECHMLGIMMNFRYPKSRIFIVPITCDILKVGRLL